MWVDLSMASSPLAQGWIRSLLIEVVCCSSGWGGLISVQVLRLVMVESKEYAMFLSADACGGVCW